MTEEDASPATASRSKTSCVSRSARWSQRELRRQAANGPPPLLTVSWDSAKRTEVPNPKSSLNQLSVMDLHPAKTYHVRMFAANSVGQSDASNVLTVRTSEAGTATSCSDGHFLTEALLL